MGVKSGAQVTITSGYDTTPIFVHLTLRYRWSPLFWDVSLEGSYTICSCSPETRLSIDLHSDWAVDDWQIMSKRCRDSQLIPNSRRMIDRNAICCIH